jgi:ubiquinone/menaquinone biosynthesis C-methylase UbiE
MKLLGSIAHEGKGLSDYRSRRLVLASNHVIVITIFVLLVGVILAHLLPSGLSSIAWIITIAALGHLALLVIGGLLVTLLVRHQRTQSRRMVIDSIPWRGTEMVLDVACGTGMLLNGCARKLTTGKAIGVDLWQQPIAGSANVLMMNAKAEGVADKVHYQEMDARHLTFEDQRFDVVVSSFALHHIGTQRADREQAVMEMIRVLAPGGHLSLVDTGSMIEMADDVISQAGLEIVSRQKTHFFQVVTARKALVR